MKGELSSSSMTRARATLSPSRYQGSAISMVALMGASMIAQAWRGVCAISAGVAELPPESASLWKRRPC